MKRSFPALSVVLGCCIAAWAAGPAPLTSIRAIQALTNPEANQHRPVDFEATVTFFRANENTLFVQDGNTAIYVFPPKGAVLVPGDRVRITGTTRADFSPSVVSKTITLLRHGAVPRPVPANYDDLVRGRLDCMLVTVHAVIRSVDVQMRHDTRSFNVPMHPITRVQLLADGGYIEALVDGFDAGSLSELLDAGVEVTGIASFNFDGKMQPTGVALNVTSRANFKPVTLANADPWSIPATPMGSILGGYRVRDLTQRVRVHGSITYYQPGSAVVVQDGTKSVWVSTMTHNTMRIGDIADAIGFPDTHNGHLALNRAEIKDRQIFAPILPKPVTVKELMGSGNLFDLVSVEGQVAASVHLAAQDEYVLENDGQIFTAILHHSESMGPLKQIPIGSRVRATGICNQEDSNKFIAQLPFEILLRTPDDIAIVTNPSPLSPRNLLMLVGLLLAVLFAVGARGWLVERKMRRQTTAMAYLEQRRGRILEDINSSRPLAAIIEEITELVSCKLKGAPCWCQIAGGAQLGNCPPKINAFRVIQAEIPARSGPPLGSIFSALDPLTKPSSVEHEALSMASALAALAIETRRLYTDLRHRSEFDLLTDTLNRFSLDKRLDDLIAEARESAGLIGLVYVDLDRFKQINDSHGHQIGDLYLQEVCLRMKRQLRNKDSLARIGGDEFAVLVPDVHSRADVEEIALRLEQCFDEPFTAENVTLQSSASVGIAVYPQDATNKNLLFRVADTAMYAAKHAKRSPLDQSAYGTEGNTAEAVFGLKAAGR
jgi:diguanylate cyclase (GGDEF)-like protein